MHEQISEQMWSLWPQLIACFHEWAIDYFENLLVPLDNFISRGTPHFLAGTSPNYLQQVMMRSSAVPARPRHCADVWHLISQTCAIF